MFGATLQYYPLLHSAFWVEHKLWGDATLGYHLVKIFLHCRGGPDGGDPLAAAGDPGGVPGGGHLRTAPACRWNRWPGSRNRRTPSPPCFTWAPRWPTSASTGRGQQPGTLAALGLFVLALLSKTVTATLPGRCWWSSGGSGDGCRGSKTCCRLLPFFLLGAGMGMITAWWELEFNKCVGPEFEFTPVQRILIAGRAVWFHLGKLFWPVNLTFIYPRWQVDSGAWWQYLFPLGGGGLVGRDLGDAASDACPAGGPACFLAGRSSR